MKPNTLPCGLKAVCCLFDVPPILVYRFLSASRFKMPSAPKHDQAPPPKTLSHPRRAVCLTVVALLHSRLSTVGDIRRFPREIEAVSLPVTLSIPPSPPFRSVSADRMFYRRLLVDLCLDYSLIPPRPFYHFFSAALLLVSPRSCSSQPSIQLVPGMLFAFALVLRVLLEPFVFCDPQGPVFC